MQHFIFVRHSKVERNPDIPSAEWQLSENGRILTQQLAPKLAAYQPTRVITSHEAKAIGTGQIVADHWQLPCHAADGLQEHDRQGAPYFPDQQQFFATVESFFKHPTELVFGNETADQARDRFATAVSQQTQQFPNDTLLITTHGTVLSLFIAHKNPQLDIIEFWKNLPLPCALICTLPDFNLIEKIEA